MICNVTTMHVDLDNMLFFELELYHLVVVMYMQCFASIIEQKMMDKRPLPHSQIFHQSFHWIVIDIIIQNILRPMHLNQDKICLKPKKTT